MSYEKRFQYSYEMTRVWIGQIRRVARNRYSGNGCFEIPCVFSTYECIYTKIKYNAMWTTFSNSFFLDKLWLHLKNLVHNIIMRNIDEIWKKNLNRTISMLLEKLLYLGYFNSNCRETLCVFSSHIPLYNAIFAALKFEKFFFIDFFVKRYNTLAIHSYIYYDYMIMNEIIDRYLVTFT